MPSFFVSGITAIANPPTQGGVVKPSIIKCTCPMDAILTVGCNQPDHE